MGMLLLPSFLHYATSSSLIVAGDRGSTAVFGLLLAVPLSVLAFDPKRCLWCVFNLAKFQSQCSESGVQVERSG